MAIRKPDYYKELKPSGKRRALWHDYRSRSIYMVSVNKAPGAPRWGILDVENAEVALTHEGQIILDELRAIPKFNPDVQVFERVIMPDHLHCLIYVTKPISRPLGRIVQMTKSASTSKIRALNADAALDVFEEGFHDRILRGDGQLDSLRRYVLDNPRRLAVRKAFPERFRRVSSLMIDGISYEAYGNTLLMGNPLMEQVVVHRSDSEPRRARLRQFWAYVAANRGVLVSPFVSPMEKTVRDEAIELGGKLILVRKEPFGERWKPTESDFALCEQGRLLIISLGIPGPVSRASCLEMNALAATIARSAVHGR